MATRAYTAKQALVAVLEKHQGGPLHARKVLAPEAQELAQLGGKTPLDTLGAIVSNHAKFGKPADKAKGLYFEKVGVGEYQLAHEPHPTDPAAIAALAASKGETAPTEQEAAKQRVETKRADRRKRATTKSAATKAKSTKTTPAKTTAASSSSPTRRQGKAA